MKTSIAINSVIARRQSVRAFASDPLSDEVVSSLLEAGRWAPSSMNNQPWRFILVREPQALARVHAGLLEGNAWAKHAPALLIIAADPRDDVIAGDRLYYLFDCGLAVENILLQATDLGLASHPMAGFREEVIKEALGIPDASRVPVVIALGYPGRLEDLDAVTQEKELRPRTRKPLSEIVYVDGWEERWSD